MESVAWLDESIAWLPGMVWGVLIWHIWWNLRALLRVLSPTGSPSEGIEIRILGSTQWLGWFRNDWNDRIVRRTALWRLVWIMPPRPNWAGGSRR